MILKSNAQLMTYLYMQSYAIETREDWVRDWPGQVVLATSQIYWTAEVHECFKDGEASLKNYLKKLNQQITNLVNLVRGNLTKQQRISLGALVCATVFL